MTQPPQAEIAHDEFKRLVKVTFIAETGRDSPWGFHSWLQTRLERGYSTVTAWFAPPEKDWSRPVPGYALNFLHQVRRTLDAETIEAAEQKLDAYEQN